MQVSSVGASCVAFQAQLVLDQHLLLQRGRNGQHDVNQRSSSSSEAEVCGHHGLQIL